MRPKLILMLLVMLIAAGYAAWDATRTPEVVSVAPPIQDFVTPQPAPDFVFETLDGKKHALSDLKGKTVLVNFWATWCAPCVIEFPQMLELAEKHKDNIVLIALSVDADGRKIDEFLSKRDAAARKRLKLPNVLIGRDADKKISQDMFQTYLYPETYVVSTDLTIRHKIAGVVDWLSPEIEAVIKP